MAMIKKALPRQIEYTFLNNDLLQGGKDEILQMQINIPDFGTKSISDLTSKDIYRIFLLDNIPIIPSKIYWKDKLATDEIDWDTWYMVNTINVFIPRPVKDFNWRLTNGLVNFNSKLRHMRHKDGKVFSDGRCEVCVSDTYILENGSHCLFECPNSNQLWKKIGRLLSYVEDRIINITLQHALTGFWQDEVNNETLLKNMVISITRFHIWKVRNSIKLDDKVIDLSGSCKILKATFINHIEILLSLHKENEPLKLYLTNLKQGIHEHNLL